MDRFLSSSSSSFFFSFFLSISRGIVFVSFSFSLPLSLSLSYLRVVPQSPLEGTAGVVVLHAIGVEGLFVFFRFFHFSSGSFFLSERRRKKKGFEGRKIVSSSFPSQIPPPFTSISPLSLVITSSTRTSRCGVSRSLWSLSGYSSWSRACFFFFGGGGVGGKKGLRGGPRSRKGATGQRGFLSFLNARPLLLPFLSFSLSLSPPPLLCFSSFSSIVSEAKSALLSYLADKSVGVLGVARGAAGLLMLREGCSGRRRRRRKRGQSSCCCRCCWRGGEPDGEPLRGSPAAEKAPRCGSQGHGWLVWWCRRERDRERNGKETREVLSEGRRARGIDRAES